MCVCVCGAVCVDVPMCVRAVLSLFLFLSPSLSFVDCVLFSLGNLCVRVCARGADDENDRLAVTYSLMTRPRDSNGDTDASCARQLPLSLSLSLFPPLFFSFCLCFRLLSVCALRR